MSVPAEECFDVVDADDRVIAQAPRSVVHQQNLLHRAVHVFVFTCDGIRSPTGWTQTRLGALQGRLPERAPANCPVRCGCDVV